MDKFHYIQRLYCILKLLDIKMDEDYVLLSTKEKLPQS